MGRKSEKLFRVIHRYLGFFLAGIMIVYAISGIVLTFRNTDYLKSEVHVNKILEANLTAENLGGALGMGRFKVDREEGDVLYFDGGTYNKNTGVADYTIKQLPILLENMNKIHKMHSGHPLFWLGIFFGVALLFFAVSAFWMFKPTTSVFKKGLYFTLGGVILTLVLLFV
ncbi:PepSY domain-containing protein [Maribacter arenosus]|uniref:PepSY domain-containing protein n=1 Tax=Maribacter arenosus TaxID=1854708 RepID=A0ABR7VDR3_9FLAO|nr:PepSY domain-containing protein [Maribacter arenosus]MBD0851779.1 PepSY domain-containing protein [Maribacter arenosus]